MKNNIHFSSKSEEWGTPSDFFCKYNEIYKFTLDVCANKSNAKCERFFTEEQNGLMQPWSGVCWMNPPYGKEINKWMKKAYDESREGVLVVALVPSRTDTRWWHDYAMKGEIEFIKGRLKFNGHKNSAPFPSAIVIFKKDRND